MSVPLTRSAAAKKRKTIADLPDRKKSRVSDEIDELHYAFQAVSLLVALDGMVYDVVAERRASDEFSVVREHRVHEDVEQLYLQLQKRISELPPSDDADEKRQVHLDRFMSGTMSTPEHPYLAGIFDGCRWHIKLETSPAPSERRLDIDRTPGLAACLFAREPLFKTPSLYLRDNTRDVREALGRRYMAAFLLARAVLTGKREQAYDCGSVMYAHNPLYESRLTKTGAFVNQYAVCEPEHPVVVEAIQEKMALDENEALLAGVVLMLDLEQADTANQHDLVPCLLRSTDAYECVLTVAYRSTALFNGVVGGEPLALGKGFRCIVAENTVVYAGLKTCGFAFAHTLIDALMERLNRLSRLIVQFHNEYVVPFHAVHKSRERTHELFDFVLRAWLPSPDAIVFHKDRDGSPRFYFHPHGDARSNLACNVDESIRSLNALVGVATMTREQLAPLFFGVVVEFLARMRDSRDFFSGDLFGAHSNISGRLRLGDGGGRDYLPVKLHALGSRMIAHIHDGTPAPDAYESLRSLLRSECLHERSAFLRHPSPSANPFGRMADLAAVAPLQSIVSRPWLRTALSTASNSWNIPGAPMGNGSGDVMRAVDTVVLDPAIDVPLSFANSVCARYVENDNGPQSCAPLWRCVLKTTSMGMAFGNGTTIAVIEQFFRGLVAHTAFEYDDEKQLLLLRSGDGGERCELCHTESDTLLLSHDCVSFLNWFEMPLSAVALRPCLFSTYVGHRAILEAVLLAAMHSVRLPYRFDPVVFFDNAAERLEALHAMNAFQLRTLFGDMSCDDLRALDMGFDNGHRDAYERALVNEHERTRSFLSIFDRDTTPTAVEWRRDYVRAPVVQLMCGFGYTSQPKRTDRMSFDVAMQLLDTDGIVNLVAEHGFSREFLIVDLDNPQQSAQAVQSVRPAVADGVRRIMRSYEQRNVAGIGSRYVLDLMRQGPDNDNDLTVLDESILELYQQEQTQFKALCALRVLAYLCKWLEESDDARRVAFYHAVTARKGIAPYDTARAEQDPRVMQRRELFDTLRESVPKIDGNLYRVPTRAQMNRIALHCNRLCTPVPAGTQKRMFEMPRSTPCMTVEVKNLMRLQPIPCGAHEWPRITTCAHSICFADDYVDYAQFCGDMEHVLSSALDGFQIA